MTEIVIELNDTTYESLTSPSVVIDFATIRNLIEAIVNGKVLPKGHGRLIDADELFDKIQFADFSSSDDVNEALLAIGDAPTIIEADKGEE